jgi:hypothetical protein
MIFDVESWYSAAFWRSFAFVVESRYLCQIPCLLRCLVIALAIYMIYAFLFDVALADWLIL